ncbi:hypothetical protein MNBD_BACTEROID03-214 [hydrothermal vent metagenome]|uniref:HTTM-like domain-containing protein n=1 Tax=hydrothermal vent metagenome TaxID=652676 RepID=A0A3B0T1E6_9ZZZZ
MLQSILGTIRNENVAQNNVNPFTWVYGLGRSLIAIALLSSFIFTDVYLMFESHILNSLDQSNLLYNRINLFVLIGYDNLIWSKVAVIAILSLVISGYFPRITGLLHFWVFHSFHNACLYLDGGDQIGTILTALLVPITLLDSRVNHWSAPIIKTKSFTMFLGRFFFTIIAVQMAFIYFHTAVEKIYKLEEWTNGTAMYYILQGKYFGLSDFFVNLIKPFIGSKAVFFLTWWVMLSHLALAFALFLKRENKLVFFYVGLSLHAGIAILMGLYSFSLVMIGGITLYFLPFNLNLKPWKIPFTKKISTLRQSLSFLRS